MIWAKPNYQNPGKIPHSPIICSLRGHPMQRLVHRGFTPIVLVFVGLLLAGRLGGTAAQPGQSAKAIKPFVLPDAAGKSWALADHKGKKAIVVLFLGTQCPINNSYAPRLAELY